MTPKGFETIEPLGFFGLVFVFCFLGVGVGGWPRLWQVEVPGQGLNVPHSSDLGPCSDHAGSLTCCATRELPGQGT